MPYDLSKIEFKNEKRFLSNMFPTEIVFTQEQIDRYPFEIPFEFDVTDLTYASSEHLYQAMKSRDIGWHRFLLSLTPEKTKTNARRKLKTLVANGKDTFIQRDDFHNIKYDVMKLIVFMKFDQNKDLRKKLIAITGHIEERNCWGDRYWGTVDGIGSNNLGKILMEVRDYFLGGVK